MTIKYPISLDLRRASLDKPLVENSVNAIDATGRTVMIFMADEDGSFNYAGVLVDVLNDLASIGNAFLSATDKASK